MNAIRCISGLGLVVKWSLLKTWITGRLMFLAGRPMHEDETKHMDLGIRFITYLFTCLAIRWSQVILNQRSQNSVVWA